MIKGPKIRDKPAATLWGPAYMESQGGVPLVWLACEECGDSQAYLATARRAGNGALFYPVCYRCGMRRGPDRVGPEMKPFYDQQAAAAAYLIGGSEAVAALTRDRVVSGGADLQDAVPEEP